MDNDKSPWNDGITKEFYVKFWDAVKEPLCASIQQSFIVSKLSTSQKQAITKLIEKKDRHLLKPADLPHFTMYIWRYLESTP